LKHYNKDLIDDQEKYFTVSPSKISLDLKKAKSSEKEMKEIAKHPCKFYIVYGQCSDINCR